MPGRPRREELSEEDAEADPETVAEAATAAATANNSFFAHEEEAPADASNQVTKCKGPGEEEEPEFWLPVLPSDCFFFIMPLTQLVFAWCCGRYPAFWSAVFDALKCTYKSETLSLLKL